MLDDTYDDKKILKEDINFLEYPNWVLDAKTKLQQLIIEKSHGKYEVLSPKGLPTHFDKIVLYCVLYQLLNQTHLQKLEIITTRYAIAKSIFNYKVTDTEQLNRIMKSLEKWHTISIKFEGTFYEEDSYTIRCFHIIDDVIFNSKTKKLFIRFNQQYIQHMHQTKFYKFIDFNEYKKLTRSVSARLYEILAKNFKERNKWYIDIRSLAEKLTIEKRARTKDYYPSDVLALLKSAISEINKKTELKVDYYYNRNSRLCTFKKITNLECSVENNNRNKIDNPLLTILVNYGIPIGKVHQLMDIYTEEKIKHKIVLLKQSKEVIQNAGAWIIKAIEEDWDNQIYSKNNEERKVKEEKARKKKEHEEHKKLLEKLKADHIVYKESKIQEHYSLLPAKVIKTLEEQFTTWIKDQKKKTQGFELPEEIYKKQFLCEMLLDEDELNFDSWLASKKYKRNLEN